MLVYSRSPVWQDYVERNWLPRLREHGVVLNWSDRATWRRRRPLAMRVFHHWAPDKDFNPMAILFPRFRPVGLDPLSSACWFQGCTRAIAAPLADAPVVPARTWLARVGWRRHGLLEIDESPGTRRGVCAATPPP